MVLRPCALARAERPPSNTSAFWLLPLRAGSPVQLETGLSISSRAVKWLPDGKRIVFVANQKGMPPRTYVQEMGGAPRPITPEGVVLIALSPDGSQVLVQGADGYVLCPINGGPPQPLRSLTLDDNALGFTSDGRAVYAVQRPETNKIYRVDLAGGRRELWKELHSADSAGSRGMGRIMITPDGKSIAYMSVRTVSELYLVEGLK